MYLMLKIINKINNCRNCDLYKNGRASPYMVEKFRQDIKEYHHIYIKFIR